MRGCRSNFFMLFSILLLAGSSLPAEELHYSDSWSDQGLTVISEQADGLELVFSLERWQLGETVIDGDLLRTVIIPEGFLPNNAGAPDLPGLGHFIALPNGATATLEILDIRTETFQNIDLAPAPRIPLETEDGPLDYTRNLEIYSRDAMYPDNPVLLGGPQQLRGVNARMLGITPFQYNPVSRELIVYRDIRIAVSFQGGDGHFGEDRLRSRWWDPILKSAFINFGMIEPVEYRVGAGQRTPDYEYVIICPDDPVFISWADSIKTFRNEQGISTGVYTVTDVGGNTTSAIESFVNDAYEWDIAPSAFLLLADYGTGSSGIISPNYGSCVSDNIYADVDGDHLPEIAFARMTATGESHLSTFVGKALDYERNPPTNTNFYDEPIIAGGWQTSRWFILCDETLLGFMEQSLGKSPVREYALYEGSPDDGWSEATNTATVVNYFGPIESDGLGYIPATPDHLTDFGGNATRLNADINSGAFLLQHRDHGGVTGWGHPSYHNSDLAGLYNDDLTFVFSINCLTGKYNVTGDCFAEAFHRHNQGALGVIAASETSFSFVNDVYIWGMYDYFWPDFMPAEGAAGPHKLLPAFGNVSGKIHLHGSNWPFNTWDKEVTYYLFHHHGDAFTSVYSEVPRSMTIFHDPVVLAGVGTISVAADAGALIGISKNGEYLVSATAMGLPQSIVIPPQGAGEEIVVTVTKQNFYRYRQTVAVVPPEGAYLIYESVAVLDEGGDDDGMLDGAEAAGLTLMLENVGNETSTGVSATIDCEDEFITIVEATQAYPDIPAAGFGTNALPFELNVAGNIPDGHPVLFTYEVTGNEGSWDGQFVLEAQAPLLASGAMLVNDALPEGGDGSGTADAGETFKLRLDIVNDGHSDTGILSGILSSSDPNLMILDGLGSCPAIPVGGQGSTDFFQLEISPLCPEPAMIELQLDLTGDGGFAATLTYYLAVGGWFDDFEIDKGWTVVSTATSGHWARVDPLGTTYDSYPIQPEDDHSPAPGTLCFVTGNGTEGGTAGENDVDAGATTLTSPVFHLDGAATAMISYWRWYTNDRGNNPGVDCWTVEASDDGETWVQLERTVASDASWTQHSFDLADYITLTDQVRVRFIADDADQPSLVEAAVDDFFLDATFPILTDVGEDGEAPAKLVLGNNYPNPFNPKTTIRFDLPTRSEVELGVYDVTGRRVLTLHRGELAPGHYEIVWDGCDEAGRPVASGVYFSRLIAGERDLTRKMVLLK